MTDQLTLDIYSELCKYYSEQINLNIDLFKNEADLLKAEKKLHKMNYITNEEMKQFVIESFTCKFKDAFEMKKRFDAMLKPKERFYHFKNLPLKVEKSKRVYQKRIKPIMPSLPKVSIWKQMLYTLKVAS